MSSKFCRRATSRFVAALVVLGALVTSLSVGVSGAGAVTSVSGFYLDLGASASVGFQPTQAAPHGQATDEGYANDIVNYEAARGVSLSLTELGCPGETTTTMISGVDHCYAGQSSQLDAAVDFLESRFGQPGIVTIDLGFNDLRQCLAQTPVNEDCVNAQLDQVAEQLPYILTTLKAAAGPDVSFVGVGHYNPYLADAIHRSWGVAFASRSKVVLSELNETLSDVYASANVPMADVSGYFNSYGHSRVHLRGVGDVSGEVARICDLTWMCAAKPYGPNIHPNDLGYAMIASAIESQLPQPW